MEPVALHTLLLMAMTDVPSRTHSPDRSNACIHRTAFGVTAGLPGASFYQEGHFEPIQTLPFASCEAGCCEPASEFWVTGRNQHTGMNSTETWRLRPVLLTAHWSFAQHFTHVIPVSLPSYKEDAAITQTLKQKKLRGTKLLV